MLQTITLQKWWAENRLRWENWTDKIPHVWDGVEEGAWKEDVFDALKACLLAGPVLKKAKRVNSPTQFIAATSSTNNEDFSNGCECVWIWFGLSVYVSLLLDAALLIPFRKKELACIYTGREINTSHSRGTTTHFHFIPVWQPQRALGILSFKCQVNPLKSAWINQQKSNCTWKVFEGSHLFVIGDDFGFCCVNII